MEYSYEETVDWGIIRRQWRAADSDYLILLERHEEDRFTVTISHDSLGLLYHSFSRAAGKLTFVSLEEAKAHAAVKLAELQP